MSTPTQSLTLCDLIRSGVSLSSSGNCSGVGNIPTNCKVIDLAKKMDQYFKYKYDPSMLLSSTNRTVRQQEMQNLMIAINQIRRELRDHNGADTPVNFTWSDFTYCLWKPDGSPGNNGHK